jgi:DNA-binding CsgD family transcriptional regulator
MQNFPSHTEYTQFLKQNNMHIALKSNNYYLKQNAFLNNLIDALPCAVYMLNYQTGQYLFVSKSCVDILGYTNKEIIKMGNVFYASHIHPDDLKIISGKVFKEFLTYTKSMPLNELKECRFSYNYRIKRKDGQYIHLLQQYVVLECNSENYPVLTFGFVTDISAHKNDNKVVFSVSHHHKTKGFSITTPQSYPNANINISKRENDVIKHLIQGLSSKQIAQKLHLSLHTINAHRRNILQKINCKNTAELVSYAMQNGLG